VQGQCPGASAPADLWKRLRPEWRAGSSTAASSACDDNDEVVTVLPRQKSCARCGEPFRCNGVWFCWCREVRLDEATRTALGAQYADCLCRACLEAVARGKEAARRSEHGATRPDH